ncbi:DUF4876 domain-containing protein [Alistipes sp.]|uniref:DUF4876 domain-containing protein n=1 Tax=Alistipes sp. TaxID=1872444 RepID=UPI0025C600C8|nr:DUF4876 domain-containing protein [Alistipes sp.]
MMTNLFKFFIASTLLLFAACSDNDDDHSNGKTPLTLRINMPISVEQPKLKTLDAIFTEVTSGQTIQTREFTAASEGSYTVTTQLKAGTYNLTLNGVVSYTLNSATVESYIEASREGITVTEGQPNEISIESSISTLTSNDFVIEEIFFTGTLTPEGNQYDGDKYVKITNNTDRTLYADGLILMDSEFLTVSKYNYTPDIMSEFFSISNTLIVPGKGKDYPVAPGKSIVIADTAIDHRQYNPRSFDLSKADFEYHNERDDEDVDNPLVPNMISSSLGKDMMWTFHNRGFKSYAIGRFGEGVTAASFAQDNFYTAEYEMVVPGHGSFPMSCEAWKFPNAWITDAVNLSIEEQFAWIVTAPTLDSGWSYCGKIDHDQTRYGKSVIRKSVKMADGRTLLKDTNNSTVDFTPESTPSLMQ